MGAITGQGESYNLPNYVGELFNVSPTDTPLLSAIGGMTGGKSVTSKQFTWQTTDLAGATQTAAVEGADPTMKGRTRSEVINVTQIMQYGVEVSYTKQAAVGNLSGQSIIGNQPVQDELAFQLDMAMKTAARDIEHSFIQGTYVADTDISTARKTRGMLEAISTNEVAGGAAALTQDMVDEAMKKMADSGAPFETPVIFANAFQKQALSFLKPVFLDIPGKGHFFVEPLAQTGAAYKYQVYGEIGLEYGPEQFHAKITDLATS